MNPQMLALLRESRGLSQSALAKSLGFSQSVISRAENGLGDLDSARLNAVAEHLRYPVEAFDWPDEAMGFGSSSFHHRKQQALGQGNLQRIHANVNLARIRVGRLLRGLDIQPRFELPSYDVDDLGSPAEVARAVRAYWRLPMGPVVNMTRVLENAGILVVRADLFSTKISAITSPAAPGTPAIAILNEGQPADRDRFTLAHEVGHLVMHDIPGRAEDAEREADAFASEFLMPASEIRSELQGLDLARAAQLKVRWRTSMASIVRRARDLQVIDEAKYRSLNVQISQRGWRRAEPVEVPREEPSLLGQVIDVHHREHGYTTAELASVTGLNLDEYVALFSDGRAGAHLRAI